MAASRLRSKTFTYAEIHIYAIIENFIDFVWIILSVQWESGDQALVIERRREHHLLAASRSLEDLCLRLNGGFSAPLEDLCSRFNGGFSAPLEDLHLC